MPPKKVDFLPNILPKTISLKFLPICGNPPLYNSSLLPVDYIPIIYVTYIPGIIVKYKHYLNITRRPTNCEICVIFIVYHVSLLPSLTEKSEKSLTISYSFFNSFCLICGILAYTCHIPQLKVPVNVNPHPIWNI